MMGWEKSVRSSLTAETARAVGRAAWQERWFSLWSPVTVFGLCFLVHLTIVESSTCAFLWAQPIIQGIGLLALGVWAVLVVLRNFVKPFKQLRLGRNVCEETVAEVDRLEKKHGARLNPKQKDELKSLGTELFSAYAGTNADAMHVAAEKLHTFAEKAMARAGKGGVFDFGAGFVKALAVALLIRSVLIEPFKIPSGSMIPTLEIGDQIFVNKFIYGVRIPFTDFVPFVIVREPKKGDVIVFNNPVETDKDFIKRVIATPGDKVTFEGSNVTVNGQPLDAVVEQEAYRFWDDPGQNGNWHEQLGQLSREKLGDQQHLILRVAGNPYSALRSEFTVPPRSVFVMGDNRDHSQDSRFALGRNEPGVVFVPYGSIKGKAMVIWLSLSHGGFMSNFFGGTGLRTDRLFRPLALCPAEPARPSAIP